MWRAEHQTVTCSAWFFIPRVVSKNSHVNASEPVPDRSNRTQRTWVRVGRRIHSVHVSKKNQKVAISDDMHLCLPIRVAICHAHLVILMNFFSHIRRDAVGDALFEFEHKLQLIESA